MADAVGRAALLADDAPVIDWRNLIWAGIAVGLMIAAIVTGDQFALTLVHAVSGLLWTGFDLFLGFVLGPILRRQDYAVRRAISLNLMPRTLFIMTTLAIIAPTSGWYLAELIGYTDLAWPQYGWVVAAVAITTALGVVGVGVILPANLIVFFELRKRDPDRDRIARVSRIFFRTTAVQGAMQIAIMVVMAKFAVGL